jgi:hypothetical protein
VDRQPCICDTALQYALLVLSVTYLKNIRLWLTNSLIFLVMAALVYGAAEYAFVRVFPRLFPVAMVQKFEEPDGILPVLQSSKSGFYPHDYIALAGDSYAMGMGDAMYEQQPNIHQLRFHSAHSIQDLTGKDVMAFGLPGSGSIRGAISNPVSGLHYLRKLVDESFPAPQRILLYFYEGNDLTENWMYYEKTFLPDHSAADYENPAVFDEYVRKVALGRQHLYLAAEAATVKNRLFFTRFVARIFSEQVLGRKFYRKKYPGEFGLIYVPQSHWVPRRSENPVNRAMVAGQTVPLLDNLQGPSMDLSPEQLQHAVGTFSKALAWSRQYFAETHFTVVYIPSVLSTYQLAGSNVDAQNYFSENTRFDTVSLENRHVWIQSEIKRVCSEQGVPFIDATPDLREAALMQTLHGPNDWNHFNKRGYQVLGESIVRQLPAQP